MCFFRGDVYTLAETNCLKFNDDRRGLIPQYTIHQVPAHYNIYVRLVRRECGGGWYIYIYIYTSVHCHHDVPFYIIFKRTVRFSKHATPHDAYIVNCRSIYYDRDDIHMVLLSLPVCSTKNYIGTLIFHVDA